jgi:hypothetical protein
LKVDTIRPRSDPIPSEPIRFDCALEETPCSPLLRLSFYDYRFASSLHHLICCV